MSLIAAAVLLGMYLNASGYVVASTEKTLFAVTMVIVNAIGVNIKFN
jgi:hypothetical protein